MSFFTHRLQYFSRKDCLMLWKSMMDRKGSIDGRTISSLQFKTCTSYKMEISAEKTKLLTNSANGI